jgi:hypothetical protein
VKFLDTPVFYFRIVFHNPLCEFDWTLWCPKTDFGKNQLPFLGVKFRCVVRKSPQHTLKSNWTRKRYTTGIRLDLNLEVAPCENRFRYKTCAFRWCFVLLYRLAGERLIAAGRLRFCRRPPLAFPGAG